MATETVSPETSTPKISRYRSVRRAQEQQAQHQSPPPVPALPPMPAVPADMEPRKDAPVSRSMSRYRRPTVSHATAPAMPPPRANTLQSQQAPPNVQPVPSSSRIRAASSPQHASHSANTAQHRPRTAKRSDASAPSTQSRSPRADDAARDLLLRERERQRVLKEKYEAEARATREAKQAELDRLDALRREEEEAALRQAQREAEEVEALRRQKEELRAEHERGKRLRKAEAQKVHQQREDDARRLKEAERERRARTDEDKARKAKIEAERPRKAPSASPPVSPPRHDTNFGLFKRRKDDGLTQEAPAMEPSRAPQLTLNLSDREPETIRPGGGGVVLGIDAPTSAVNAGDRRVTVVCGKKRILLPVTPTTTPLDLIKTAATVLSEPIDVRTAVMQELFIKVSITRPLRNYEYVRDVMNSWDADNQNELTIIDSELDGIDQDDLLAYKVAETRPEGMSCFIQYSSKPGKWSKRYLTLRPDGQLVMGKNEKAKEKDLENVLTMTDYDIYSVTQTKLAKVKPPKKICFAVKSLQKSNIFADESQYVHFFCTNDRGTATMFYKALQQWRSWYLKHQKGEGLKKKAPAHRKLSGGDSGLHASSHTRGESVGSHYQLGQFSSLLDLDDFNKQLDSIEVHFPGEFPDDKPLAGLDTRAMHARKKSTRVKQPPPTAFNRSAPNLDSSSQGITRSNSTRRSVEQQREDAFSTGGLLGRGYTQRQAAVQDREQKQNGPFTEGPSLISGMDRMAVNNDSVGLKRHSSTRSNHRKGGSGDLQRSASKRTPGMPEPLIDLRPQYRPPPQHANKGKAFNAGSGAGPLVESATSIEEAIKLPPSTDWRARPTTQGRSAHGTYGAGRHERTRSLKGRGEPLAAYTVNNHSGAPEDDNEAFTGGLLAQAGYSQGHAVVGRGVMDGSKATGPMIDLLDGNGIMPGGLLSAVPDSNGPVIDRSGK